MRFLMMGSILHSEVEHLCDETRPSGVTHLRFQTKDHQKDRYRVSLKLRSSGKEAVQRRTKINMNWTLQFLSSSCLVRVSDTHTQ